MNAIKFDDHELLAMKLAQDIRLFICGPCEDKRKKHHIINLNDPLQCECFCERVESPLSSLKRIIEN